MKRFKKNITVAVDIIELHIPSILFGAVFIMYLIMIIYRYLLNRAVFELNELCQVLYIACALMSASYSGRTNSHVAFPLLYDRLPPKIQRIFRLISNAITVALLAIMWYPCLDSAIWMMRKKTEVLDIPFFCLYALWLLFMTLSILYCIWHFIRDLRVPVDMVVQQTPPDEA